MTTIGSLFSGAGGLDLAVEQTLGARTAWHSEIDPAASKVLAARWPGVPNLGDIRRVGLDIPDEEWDELVASGRDLPTPDWTAVPPVDVICGGSPCQDVSSAGKRAGMRPGTRSGLWAAMTDAIDILRPSLVVWENVRGALSACAHSDMGLCPRCLGDESQPHRPVLRALGRVLGDLADLGYDASWCGLRASDVGAAHERFRVFLLAWPAAANPDLLGRQGRTGTPGQSRRVEPADGGVSAADTDRDTLRVEPISVTGRSRQAFTEFASPEAAADTHDIPDDRERPRPEPRSGGPAGEAAWEEYGPAVTRWAATLGRTAPAPTELAPKGGQRLSSRFDEWLMGWPEGWATQVPGVSHSDALRICGNGVVPQQAAAALQWLLQTVPTTTEEVAA